MKNKLWDGKEVITVINGHGFTDWSASGISIDTRTINKGDIFFALPGPNFDGNDFINDAIKKGACAVISNKPSKISSDKVIFVNDVLRALLKLARHSRRRSNAKIIAITGSSGKTTLKEMIANSLSVFGEVHKSKKSYNNIIGVSLSLASMPTNANYGIFEIGMNKKGEIANLAKIVSPHIAIVNNAGKAHMGSFKDQQEIKKEKTSIVKGLTQGGSLIINDNLLNEIGKIPNLNKNIKIFSFGDSKKANIKVVKYITHTDQSFLEVKLEHKELKYSVPFARRHIALNTLPAILACQLTNNPYEEFIKEFEKFKPLKGRGNKYNINYFNKDITIIDDSYNANPDSMAASINSLNEIRKDSSQRVIAFLGDMLELGSQSKILHKKLAEVINLSNIDFVYAIGKEMRYLWEDINFEKKGKAFSNVNELIPQLKNYLREGDIVLLKGSSGSNISKINNQFISYKQLRKIA